MIGKRLKEERERLGFKQPDFALIAGASKRTLIDWEQGKTSPSAVQLSALSDAGADAQYIITGTRHAEYPSATDGPSTAKDGIWLSQKHKELIDAFDQLTEDEQKFLIRMLRGLV